LDVVQSSPKNSKCKNNKKHSFLFGHMTRRRPKQQPVKSPSSEEQPSSEEEDESSPIDEETRRTVIEDYEHEIEEKQKMEQAVRDAEIKLMPAAERLDYGTLRMRDRLQHMQKEYLTILDQFRHLIRSCPLSAHTTAEYSIYECFPYLILPRKTGHDVLRDVRSTVQKQMLQKYGAEQTRLIQDLSDTWYAATKEALGFTSNAVPHAAILQCMLPLYADRKTMKPLQAASKTQNPQCP
jgi:hypothetical protein